MFGQRKQPRLCLSGTKPPEALGHIERLIVENFKSYEGYHEIGPFDKFTCIIGPNGSGKSNVMDAISFCLGIRAKHLRGDRLKDLVYRREEEDIESNTRKASVTLAFRTGQGEVLHYERNINPHGQGAYRYGPPHKMKNVNYDGFLEALAKQEVHVKARNFLVFQGDVMELARRQGTDLTGVLETISGSVHLKEDYEKLSKELEMVQESARMHFQHRREIESAVALLAKQREEVRRYQSLRERRQQLLLEAVLFKLLCAEVETARNDEAGEELRSGLQRAEADLRSTRKEADEAEGRRKKIESAVEEAQSQFFVLSSNMEQIKPEISQCRKQLSHWSAKMREKKAAITEETNRHETLEAQAKVAKQDRVKAEEEIEKLKARDVTSVIQMSDQQRAAYERAVAQTDSTNSRTRERLRESEEQLRLCGRELQADRRDLKDLEDQRVNTDEKIAEMAREMAGIDVELANEVSSLEELQRRKETSAREVEKFALFRDSLTEEQRSLRFQLDAAQSRREKLEQIEVKQRVADELRDAFPAGVIGRISELVLPTQRRFDLPLQMSLGSMAEAFVVVDAKTGRECVEYLKRKQISTETFLPLDRMVEPGVGPLHLLTQGFDARRLAVMCVQHNEKFLERHFQWQAEGPTHIDRTLRFLLNGTIIVDDLEEAKATAYRDARRRGLMPRVVTLDGEVVAPNGNMMVQSVSVAGRVEFGGAEQLHEIRVQEQKLLAVERDLSSLREELGRAQRRESEIREDSRQFEERRRICVTRKRGLEGAIMQEQKILEGRIRRIEELNRKIEGMIEREAEIEKSKDQLEVELLKVGKKFFASLNRELGVDDVREIMRKEMRERRRVRDEIEQFEDVVRSLLNQEKSIEKRISGGSKLDTLKKDCEQYERDSEAVQKRQQDLEERGQVLSERCEVAKGRMKDLQLQKEQLEGEVKQKKVDVHQNRAKVDDCKKKLKHHNEKVRVVLTIRCSIFRDCNERQIEIPLLQEAGGALEQVVSRECDLDDLPLEDLDAASRAVHVDYSALPDDKEQLAHETRLFDTKNIEAEYEQQVADITREMDTLNPNMRAYEQCEAEEGRLVDIRKQAEEAAFNTNRLTREFESVKAERIRRFMHCFKHVEAKVHPFYKDLTSYDGYEGGSAYLDLDDAEEPYNGGITFTACPPGKRFFPMELLSGGERSMASMALLFAMHSYKPPPFMILDEVDAPFDRKNTNSLVAYLKKLHFQCLVISLKDSFFSHSDSIVGIFKDKEIQSSGSLSLPLKRLGEESETPETEVPAVEDSHE